MAEQKMTYVQALDNAIAEVSDSETKARLEDLKASIVKKASSKKKTVDNSGMEAEIRKALAVGSMSPTDLAHAINASNTQKVSAVVGKMADVTVTRNGKKVTYSLSSEE